MEATPSTLLPAAEHRPRVIFTTIGASGGDPYPMIDRVWEMFISKGIRTVLFSIGNSPSSAADAELAESIGCPIHSFPFTEKGGAEWKEVQAILTARAREGANATYPFSEGIESKWILPKNIRSLPALPWWGEGNLTLAEGGSPVKTASVDSVVQTVCEAMNLKDCTGRIDILKIDTELVAPGLERAILPAILSAGYRPTIVLVKWHGRPDVDLSYTLAAGHLQNCGYTLMAKLENKFLYYFNDNDLYQLCSWEDDSCMNPLLHEIAISARGGI